MSWQWAGNLNCFPGAPQLGCGCVARGLRDHANGCAVCPCGCADGLCLCVHVCRVSSTSPGTSLFRESGRRGGPPKSASPPGLIFGSVKMKVLNMITWVTIKDLQSTGYYLQNYRHWCIFLEKTQFSLAFRWIQKVKNPLIKERAKLGLSPSPCCWSPHAPQVFVLQTRLACAIKE